MDIFWDQNMLVSAIIEAKFDTNFKLAYQDNVKIVEIKKGDVYTYNPSLATQ